MTGVRQMKGENVLKGVACVVSGGILWGFSGTCGQYLMSRCGVDAGWLTSARTILSGGLLLLFCCWHNRKSVFAIWHSWPDIVRLLAFSILGILLCQFSYLKAIFYTNSGMATILQYTGPIMILVFTCLRTGRLPRRNEAIAIGLAVLGVFLLATHGDVRSMVVTPEGLFWGLLSAAGLACYTMVPGQLLQKYGTMTAVGWAMFICGVVFCVLRQDWNNTVPLDMGGLAALASLVFLGTLVAFSLYLQGVKEIGPVRGSMLATVEPVSATVCMVVWLGTAFGIMDAAGFVCVLATIFLLAK